MRCSHVQIFLRKDGDGKGWCLTVMVVLIGPLSRNTSKNILSRMLVKLPLFMLIRSLRKIRTIFVALLVVLKSKTKAFIATMFLVLSRAL